MESLRRLHRVPGSFRYACAGVVMLFRTQANAVVHAVAAVLAVALGLWLAMPPLEIAVVVLAIAAVLAAEAVNTALERTVDLASPGRDPRAGAAKDLAAAAVLIMAVGAVVVALLLYLPRLLALARWA